MHVLPGIEFYAGRRQRVRCWIMLPLFPGCRSVVTMPTLTTTLCSGSARLLVSIHVFSMHIITM